LLQAVVDGLFVSTDRALHFLRGGLVDDAALVPVAPYPAIPGTGFTLPRDVGGTVRVGWFAAPGLIVGSPGGGIQNVTDKNIVIGPHPSGAATVVERNGVKRVVASLVQGETAALAHPDPRKS
jgi:hypothetical protein